MGKLFWLALADGSELVTAIGNRVLVYETATGDLRHSLRGHKVVDYPSLLLTHIRRFTNYTSAGKCILRLILI